MNLHREEAINDLHDDCEILTHIATSQLHYLKTAAVQLEKSAGFIYPVAYKISKTQVESLILKLYSLREKLLNLRASKSLENLRLQTENAFQYLRVKSQLTGAF